MFYNLLRFHFQLLNYFVINLIYSIFVNSDFADRFELTNIDEVETLQESILLALHQYVTFQSNQVDAKTSSNNDKDKADLKEEETATNHIGSESEESSPPNGDKAENGKINRSTKDKENSVDQAKVGAGKKSAGSRFAQMIYLLTEVRSISIQCAFEALHLILNVCFWFLILNLVVNMSHKSIPMFQDSCSLQHFESCKDISKHNSIYQL